jgi:hypothetical protein
VALAVCVQIWVQHAVVVMLGEAKAQRRHLTARLTCAVPAATCRVLCGVLSCWTTTQTTCQGPDHNHLVLFAVALACRAMHLKCVVSQTTSYFGIACTSLSHLPDQASHNPSHRPNLRCQQEPLVHRSRASSKLGS